MFLLVIIIYSMALYMMAMAMLDEPTAHYLSIHSVSLYILKAGKSMYFHFAGGAGRSNSGFEPLLCQQKAA